MSNRQPWVYALLSGWITCKTRSPAVYLPPVGARVFLHASQALWRDWADLRWTYDLNVSQLPRGGVCGIATVAEVGPTRSVMPDHERKFFLVQSPRSGCWNCADAVTIRFVNIRSIPFIACRGVQAPTRKLPIELLAYIARAEGVEPRTA